MADAPKFPAFPPHGEDMTVRDAAIQCGGSNVYATTKGGGSETCLACGGTIAEFKRVVCIDGSMWFHMDCLNHPASISPSASARALLADPEAVERMARGMFDAATGKDGYNIDEAWSALRSGLQNGIRRALRAIAGGDG